MSSRTINNYPGFVIENTTIAVDFWPKDQPYLTHHFLTHAHTDHTKNLDSTWTDSLLYCSKVTKKLIMDLKGVDEKYIMELDLNRTHIMRLDENTTFNVTLIDANHCPGAVMFLFEGYFGSILATGDFRYSPSMFTDGPLADKTREYEICYLDNTYLHESFEKIPSRADACKEIIDCIKIARSKNDKTIFFIKMKLLGKEELVVELYNQFHVPLVVASPRYDRYTNVLGLDSGMFVTDPASDSFLFLEDSDLYMNQKIIDFSTDKTIHTIEPTAMHIKQKRNLNDSYVKIPYTDHSSFKEIGEFIRNLRPKKIVPIVRKPLPNNLSTDDTKCLNKYKSKRAPINASTINSIYRLLMKSATASVKRAVNNLSSQLNKSASHTDTPNLSKTVSRITRSSSLGQELTSTPMSKQRIMNQQVNDLTPIHLNSNIINGRVTKTRGRAKARKTQIEYEDSEDDLDALLKEAKNTTKATASPGVQSNTMRVIKSPLITAKKIPAIYKLQNIKTSMDPITEEHNSSNSNENSDRVEIADTDMTSEPEPVTGHSTIIPFTSTDKSSTDKESTTDKADTTHVSETEMSLVNDPDISSSISTDQASFNAYTEDLVKQSRWRRLSDHVEMMHNSSTEDEETFKESPGKKLKLDNDDEENSQSTETSSDIDTQATDPKALSSVKSLSSNVLSDVTNMIEANGDENARGQKEDAENQISGAKKAVAVNADQQQQSQESEEQMVDAIANDFVPTVAKVSSRRSSNGSIRFDHSHMLSDDSTNELDSDSDFELEQLHETTVFTKPASNIEEPFNAIAYWDAKLEAIGVTKVSENNEKKAYELIKDFLFSSASPSNRFNPELEAGKKFAEF